MELPISRTQLDKLGQRITATDIIADDDHETLTEVLDLYRQAMERVVSLVHDLGYQANGRVKTNNTLLDKLRREPTLKLKDVQDVAGVRIVVPGGRSDQDDAVTTVSQNFSGTGKPPRIRDRRDKPSSGYRAVHVVVFDGNLPVEVQVRTEIQDLWAQIFELLGDAWGRAMRYGGEPDGADAPAARDTVVTRRDVVLLLLELSHQVDVIARQRAEVEGLLAGQTGYQVVGTDILAVHAELVELEETIKRELRLMLQSMRREG